MRNSAVLTAILFSLSNLLAGCQTTLGLSAPPANSSISIPKETHFLVYGSNDSPGWAKVLGEFSPEVHTSAKYIDDPNAHFVILRASQIEPSYINFPLALGALTICIIPCFEYGTYTADFEVYPASNRALAPTKFHYEFSSLRGMWLPTQFGKNRTDPSYPLRELYRQFFADYAKLLNNSKIVGEKHE